MCFSECFFHLPITDLCGVNESFATQNIQDGEKINKFGSLCPQTHRLSQVRQPKMYNNPFPREVSMHMTKGCLGAWKTLVG